MIKWDLSQRYKDFSIPANQSMWYIDININNINKFKNQNHVIIPIVAEKSSDKIQHTVMIKKNIQKVGIEGMYLNIIKVIYNKPTANITLNGKKLKTFPLRSGTRQDVHSCFWSPSHGNKRRQRNKCNPNVKRRNKMITVYRWHDTTHRKSKRWYQKTTTVYLWIW